MVGPSYGSEFEPAHAGGADEVEASGVEGGPTLENAGSASNGFRIVRNIDPEVPDGENGPVIIDTVFGE